MKKATLDALMRSKFIAWLILILISFDVPLLAQDGEYFTSHYHPEIGETDISSFDIIQDSRGLMYMATRNGIIRFDGYHWEKIKTPSTVFSLVYDERSNTIYCGTYLGFGQLENADNNTPQFESLIENDSLKESIYHIIQDGNKLYGLSDGFVVVYDLTSKRKKKIGTDYSGDIIKLFMADGQLYVNTSNSGLMRIDQDRVTEIDSKMANIMGVEFMTAPDQKKLLIGTNRNELFIYENSAIQSVNIKNEYVLQSGFLDAIVVDDTELAIATLKGGVVFLNYQTGELNQIINYQSGLPDNEIYAIFKDANNGIWVAHSSGYSRISPRIPFRIYDHYDGLTGSIEAVAFHNDKLYVGTSEGLFRLEKVENYEESSYLEMDKVLEVKEKPVEEIKEEKKGLLGLFKKRKNQQIEVQGPVTTERIVYRTRIKKELKSIDYRFLKVEGVDSKVNSIVMEGGQLYAGGLDGLFLVNETEAVPIAELPIEKFLISSKHQLILAADYSGRINTYNLEEPYRSTNLFSDYTDNIQYIFEDVEGRIWFTSDDEIFYVVMDNGQIYETEVYPINNPYQSITLGTSQGENVIFVNESGRYEFQSETNSIEKINGSVQHYISTGQGKVGLFENDEWTFVGNQHQSKNKLLDLFDQLRHIHFDSNGGIWVVSTNNDLIRISPENSNLNEAYDLYLKNIAFGDQSLTKEPSLVFEQSSNAMRFEFVQPEYSSVLNLKYQFQLEGLNNAWSEWSESYSNLNFNYLPEGDYTLRVRSKDALGNISEIAPITFSIVPPYWKRPIFYAIEFFGLTLLLLISIRLRKLGYKYQLVSKLLALITLITIIEFIQTVAEHEFSAQSSPLFDFVVQVTIAIIVFPVESVIRKYVLKEKDAEIIDIIKPKTKKPD